MLNTCTNIQKKGASFKENGELNSFGLRRAIDMITNNDLPRSARVILSTVCQVAAATSAYIITKSRRTMANECGTTEATIRRNLKKAVDAGYLKSTLIFDTSAKGRGQMPTEYQFTPEFIEAAKLLNQALDKDRQGVSTAKALFTKTLQKISSFFSGKSTPRSELHTIPDQSDRQLLVSSDVKNLKENSAGAEKNSIPQKVKTWADAKHERACTKASDYAERQDRELANREEERNKLDNLLKRRAFITGVAQKRQQTSSNMTTSHNASRFDEANRQHDETMRQATKKASEARARGFSAADILAKHFPNRKKTNEA